MQQRIKKDLSTLIVLTIIIANIFIFFFSQYQVSYREIRDHDREVSIVLDNLKTFDASNTAIFVPPYTFYNYRHIMYYLPEYRVYNVDLRMDPSGKMRKIFWGLNRKTFLLDEVTIPDYVTTFATIQFFDKRPEIEGVTFKNLQPTLPYVISGPLLLIKDIYPELKIRYQDKKS